MTAELEIELRPFRTHQQHHHQVYDQVKGQYEHDDNAWSLQRVQDTGNDDSHGEIAEPHDVQDGQSAVEDQSESLVLHEVYLSYLPHDVEEEEETVCYIEPTCPGLVDVCLLCREWEDRLLDLQWRQDSSLFSTSYP